MFFDNQCNAPDDFIDSLKEACSESEHIAFRQLNLRFHQLPLIRILKQDPNPPRPDPKYSLNRVCEKTRNLIDLIESSEQSDAIQEILDPLRKLWLLLIGEIKSDGNYSIEKLIREINNIFEKLINESSKYLENDIYNIWKEIAHLIPLIDYPMIRLGYFSPADDVITICYDEICSSISPSLVDEYGAFVLCHELFHALHYQCIQRETNGKHIWSCASRPAQVRRDAVIESLAEHFSLTFAKSILSYDVWQKAKSVSTLHPFPNWGYAGAELIERFDDRSFSDPNYNLNHFFKAVFYSSVLNMEDGYQLLKKQNN